jgi:mono/diheme cytochrome c family protein
MGWQVAIAATGALLLPGCGAANMVTPKAVAFEPTIVGCSGRPTECASATAGQIRELREAHSHPCPADRPNVLIHADGTLLCVAQLPASGPTGLGLPIPRRVGLAGAGAVAEFKAGEAVTARSGCLACHRIGGVGNSGPGRNLTHLATRLRSNAILPALVDSPAPMPSFSHLPAPQRRALAYFLAQLR